MNAIYVNSSVSSNTKQVMKNITNIGISEELKVGEKVGMIAVTTSTTQQAISPPCKKSKWSIPASSLGDVKSYQSKVYKDS